MEDHTHRLPLLLTPHPARAPTAEDLTRLLHPTRTRPRSLPHLHHTEHLPQDRLPRSALPPLPMVLPPLDQAPAHSRPPHPPSAEPRRAAALAIPLLRPAPMELHLPVRATASPAHPRPATVLRQRVDPPAPVPIQVLRPRTPATSTTDPARCPIPFSRATVPTVATPIARSEQPPASRIRHVPSNTQPPHHIIAVAIVNYSPK